MVRKIVRRSTHRVVGYHASIKVSGLVPWESQIEQAYFEWLEVDPEIISFKAQPRTFLWSDTRYTPDALVATDSGSFYVEVKPDKVLEDHVQMARLTDITRRLAELGLSLKLVLRSEVFRAPLRDNVVRLMRLTRKPLAARLRDAILTELALGPKRLSDFSNFKGVDIETALLQCVVGRLICLDLQKPINAQAVFSLPSEGASNVTFQD
ncbi:hypothetical protein [Kordiimonas marina]|uniref:hypothetical protein n=1 Tax=Kordiimonas marina TaxID=2872312 RepID=UPI001FF31AA4|nr:hypothetical protein [Kordiimonas marina]MCJ9429661.1 hypothetical protein [Kordiimonas marina]